MFFYSPWCFNQSIKIQAIFKVKVNYLEIMTAVEFDTITQCYQGKFLWIGRAKCCFWLEEEGFGKFQAS